MHRHGRWWPSHTCSFSGAMRCRQTFVSHGWASLAAKLAVPDHPKCLKTPKPWITAKIPATAFTGTSSSSGTHTPRMGGTVVERLIQGGSAGPLGYAPRSPQTGNAGQEPTARRSSMLLHRPGEVARSARVSVLRSASCMQPCTRPLQAMDRRQDAGSVAVRWYGGGHSAFLAGLQSCP